MKVAPDPLSWVSHSGVRITFGMVVLNGEPFTRYNLRSIYPWAHQIIVVEGACKAAAAVATPEGHSKDETLAVLKRFQRFEDPDRKIIIVTAEDEGFPDGFWPGEKDEMSQAYARRATGNYLWQVDSDEFYLDVDLARIVRMLIEGADAISFPTLHFWGSPKYVVDGFHMIVNGYYEYHRLFRWGPGYRYTTHRPPTVVDDNGIELRQKQWLDAADLKAMRIFMYHYSFLFPVQVALKSRYYSTPGRGMGSQHGVLPQVESWEERTYRRLERPFHPHIVQTHVSWLYRFRGRQPTEVDRMMADIADGKVHVERRDCADVEDLLKRLWYRLSVALLGYAAFVLATPRGRKLTYRAAQGKYLIDQVRQRSLCKSVAARLKFGRRPAIWRE